MKLIELLKARFPNAESFPKNAFGEPFAVSYVLELLKDELQKCDEFKNARLIIAHTPIVNDVDDESKQVSMATYLLHDETVFSGKCYLYSISLSPEIFKPADIHKVVKDGCSITPTMYNSTNFRPYKQILLNYEMEMMDGSKPSREILHTKLDEILDNPTEYQMKGERGIFIRGYMGSMTAPTNPEKTLF